jgi:CHRD domain
MKTRRRGLLGGVGLLGLVAAVAAVGASVGSASVARAVARDPVVRLTADLKPIGAQSSASGRWDAVLVSRGARAAKTFTIPCPKPPPKGAPPPTHVFKCGTTMTAGEARPGYSALVWRLSVKQLSSPVTAVDVRLAASPGAAPTLAATLCTTSCTAARTQVASLTTTQAQALAAGRGSVVVHTANAPDGELSGTIVKLSFGAARS